MAANTAPVFGLTPRATAVQFTSADTTAKKTVYTPGTDGGRLEAIMAATDETAAINFQLFLTIGGVDFLWGTVNVPVGAGNTGTVPAVNLLDRGQVPGIAADGSLTLPTTAVVKVACSVTMTAAKTAHVVGIAVDF